MTTTAYPAIGLPGGMEWFWIFLIFLILFGAAALPKLFRSLGKSVREFKKAQEGLYDEIDKADRNDRAHDENAAGKASVEDRKPSGPGPSSSTNA
ncbi:MAG: twin-arginine translocase TatA/TatE family subunit [Verrucomicrobia bacterium]|nr:twin-arginine translocase TatA/TatE family subunit [Verrucomicrobiota bacterium]